MRPKERTDMITEFLTSYLARFRGAQSVEHYVVFTEDMKVHIEMSRDRARALAYDTNGDCYAIIPVEENGHSGAHAKKLSGITMRQRWARCRGRCMR